MARVVFFAEYAERAMEGVTDGAVPTDVNERIDIASSPRCTRRCDCPSESPPQLDPAVLLFIISADLSDGLVRCR